MAFKINIATNEGKTYKLETDAPSLMNKELGDKIQGIDVSPDLEGYEFEIRGTSDKSGFTSMKEVEGIGRKKLLLTYGKAFKKKPKGLSKKPVSSPKGLRMRKTVRGKVISDAITQINLVIIKEGTKKLDVVFPDQATKPAETTEQEVKPEEAPQNANPTEEPKEEPPTEGNPEEEPKESEESKDEKAHPDEEPKE